MADPADRARKLQQAEIDAALTHRKKTPTVRYTGNCAWCDAPVGPKQRWCGPECRDDWERDWNRRQR